MHRLVAPIAAFLFILACGFPFSALATDRPKWGIIISAELEKGFAFDGFHFPGKCDMGKHNI
jgi:hypothetical protein